MRWYMPDFAPLSILDGPDVGTGSADVVLHYLIGRMPQFDHRLLPATFLRLEQDSAHYHDICAPTVLATPERMKQLIFSHHAWRVALARVVFMDAERASLRRHIRPDGRMDTVSLLSDAGLSGGYVAGRSYTPAIDTALAAVSRSAVVTALSSQESALKMMELGRLDYAFGYSFELRYALEKKGVAVASAPALGDAAWQHGFFACSRGALGEQVLQALDALLEEPLPADVQRASHRWTHEDELELETGPLAMVGERS
ncbi:hypothetical protein [Radicibacter daui]|uniref:hypothetical protein n=1 Tax=Radicibacter daui TaxID=3064829 RepID=UPI0040470100